MSTGPLLSSSDVAHCVHRVALDLGTGIDIDRPPVGVEIERRVRDASHHRRQWLDELQRIHPDAVTARGRGDTETLLREGAPFILGARLTDEASFRRMSVDVLVRVGRGPEGFHYAPLIVKNNEMTETASTRQLSRGSISQILPSQATWVGGIGARRNDTMVRNGFALAHATRVLEACRAADPEHRGAMVDRHSHVWWFDLDNPDWGKWTLGRYDDAYAQRRDVLTGHAEWLAGSGPFPTTPYWHRECLACPYSNHCDNELTSRDDVSLVRFTNFEQQTLLREHGVHTRRDLARLDPHLAREARGRVLSATGDHEPEFHLGRSIDKLDELIYRARALVRDTPLRIVPSEDVTCPLADVEIDVDMESYNDVTYLWGAYVTTRRAFPGITEGYVSFVDWSEPTAETESRVFGAFWRWFDDLRARTHAHGGTFASYCFWAQAEDGAMNRAADTGAGTPTRVALDEFRQVTPPEWIDLHDVAKRHIQTSGPLGLKVLATEAGFTWRDDNPSGEASMAWFETATGDNEDALRARQRILEYNEDDCRATKALREWIVRDVPALPNRDEIPA